MVPSVGRSNGKNAIKVLLVLFIGIFVQTTFGSDLRVDHIAPDFMLLLAVAAGFAAGPDEGALIGFASGLASDLFLQSTPFGLSALAYCLAGFGTGWARANMLRQRLSLAPLAAAAGTVAGVVLFVVIGYLVGQQQLVFPGKRWLVERAFVEAIYNALFSVPAVVLVAWACRGHGATSAALTSPPGAVMEIPIRRRSLGARSRRRRRPRARVR